MGWISSLFVHKVLDAAARLASIDADRHQELYQLINEGPTSLEDPASMVSDKDFFVLLERIDALSPHGRSVPIHVGAAMLCDDYGAFGLAFKSAPDLLGSYARVERFGKVVTSIANFRVVQTSVSVVMEVIQARERRKGLTMTNEMALAAALALSREVSGDGFAPIAVHLMSERPADDRVFREHFQCPITFEADRDALEIDASVARHANRLFDDGIAKFFESHLAHQLRQFSDRSELEHRVLDLISSVLSEGVPTLTDIAGRVGMSSRTLQRRLSADGLAYQDLVMDARMALAQKLLRRTDYALAEIAFLTGFSDQSTFTRAFKRRHNQTPARFRRGA